MNAVNPLSDSGIVLGLGRIHKMGKLDVAQ